LVEAGGNAGVVCACRLEVAKRRPSPATAAKRTNGTSRTGVVTVLILPMDGRRRASEPLAAGDQALPGILPPFRKGAIFIHQL
jgi:hypothetical protein